ncbi:MAG: hypothetical protein V7776_04955 [Halopseudomonas aestusnigri]
MSLENRIRDALLDVATEVNTVRNETGDKASLSTTDKSSIVNAINELQAAIGASSGINDAATGTGETWSSQKITDQIAAAKSELTNGAPTALDTLNELAIAIGDNDTDIGALLTSLDNRVRHDINTQGLTTTQKANARTNIGAQEASAIGNTERDFVADFRGGLT